MNVLTFGAYRGMPLGGRDAYKVFDTVISELERRGLKYWIAAGTLLGLYRDKDFIPGDTDIDIEVLEGPENFDLIASVCRELGGREIRVVGDGTHVYQLAFIFNNEIIFDTYFYRKVGDKLVSWAESVNGEIAYPAYFLDTMTKVEFKGKKYPCFNPEPYLEYLYGKEWMTPREEKPVWKPL